jgi:hypothetical protein
MTSVRLVIRFFSFVIQSIIINYLIYLRHNKNLLNNLILSRPSIPTKWLFLKEVIKLKHILGQKIIILNSMGYDSARLVV